MHVLFMASNYRGAYTWHRCRIEVLVDFTTNVFDTVWWSTSNVSMVQVSDYAA